MGKPSSGSRSRYALFGSLRVGALLLSGSFALWHYGSLAIWLSGSLALWLFRCLALWLFGSLALCLALGEDSVRFMALVLMLVLCWARSLFLCWGRFLYVGDALFLCWARSLFLCWGHSLYLAFSLALCWGCYRSGALSIALYGDVYISLCDGNAITLLLFRSFGSSL